MAGIGGELPLALESGTGSELRFPLGITIVGGLLLSQLLTLYTTPVIYLALERVRARLTGTDRVYGCDFEFPAVDRANPELERLWAIDRIERWRSEVDPP